MTEPLSPLMYRVLPKQFKRIEHPRLGTVIAAAMPYPSLDSGALCAGDPDFTSDYVMDSKVRRDYVVQLCDRCPLVEACREWGIAHEEYGIWGGTFPEQRKRIRKERRQVLVEPHAGHLWGLNTDPFAFLYAGAGDDAEGQAD